MFNPLAIPAQIWAPLQTTILNIPPARLPLFPLLTGTNWLITLTILLVRWVTRGLRPYPGQSNPYVAFISDIASFELKPLFLIGASITAAGFFITVSAVHVLQYKSKAVLIKSLKHDDNDASHSVASGSESRDTDSSYIDHGGEEESKSGSLKPLSLLSIFAAAIASTALTLLSVLDTFRYDIAHSILLRTCFAGLAVQSTATAIVFKAEVQGVLSYLTRCGRRKGRGPSEDEDETYPASKNAWRSLRVQVFATLSTTIILIELFLGIAFLSLTVDGENSASDLRTAGVLEWVIAYLGSVYIWLFAGFFKQSSFHGYRAKILDGSTSEGGSPASGARSSTDEPHETLRHDQKNEERDVDPEQRPLLEGEGGSGRKYT
ncbi:hypothetical protein BJY04DRAFT_201592 [Aspergillus karnatakaensis]|uniref:uncharacterized protein n=1 Tax=Aspergillus karnatakaensis TaxID=1810916 RepID=UPI003CCE2B3A